MTNDNNTTQDKLLLTWLVESVVFIFIRCCFKHDGLSWKPICGLLDQAPTKTFFIRRGSNLLRPFSFIPWSDTSWRVEPWVSILTWCRNAA